MLRTGDPLQLGKNDIFAFLLENREPTPIDFKLFLGRNAKTFYDSLSVSLLSPNVIY